MKYSKYLPSDYQGEAITLIAGKGRYPELLKEEIDSKGIPNKLVSIANETDDSLVNKFSKEHHLKIQLGKLNDLLKSLKKLKSKYVILAGQVRPARLFSGLLPDLKMLSLLSRLKALNAETIFGSIIDEINSIGCNVIDARSFIDGHIATEGILTLKGKSPPQEAIDYGINITKNIAELNIGQGIVIKGKTVIAVEAFEGTNKMLKRVSEFKLKDCIFIKTIKENQDFRFDIPVLGINTIENLHASNIKTVVLESGSSILLDKSKVLKKAETLNIQIIGTKLQ